MRWTLETLAKHLRTLPQAAGRVSNPPCRLRAHFRESGATTGIYWRFAFLAPLNTHKGGAWRTTAGSCRERYTILELQSPSLNLNCIRIWGSLLFHNNYIILLNSPDLSLTLPAIIPGICEHAQVKTKTPGGE